MDFDDFDVFGGYGKVKEIPEQYKKFLPENIVKTRESCPYSYDPFLIYFNEKAEKEANKTIYSDRFRMWDSEKLDRLCKKHFGKNGDNWSNIDYKKIEAFISDWVGKKIVLVANIQYVNMASGYPVWRFDYYKCS